MSIDVCDCFRHPVGEGGAGEDVAAVVGADEEIDILEGIESGGFGGSLEREMCDEQERG